VSEDGGIEAAEARVDNDSIIRAIDIKIVGNGRGLNLLMAFAIEYLLQIILFRSLLVLAGKHCPDVGTAHTLSGCGFDVRLMFLIGSGVMNFAAVRSSCAAQPIPKYRLRAEFVLDL
jgi:hypothetical protein